MNHKKKPSKSLLVTGGAGFIGAHYIEHLLENNPKLPIVVLDKITYAANIDTVETFENHHQVSFYRGDIGNREYLDHIFKTHNVADIVHFAAESHVDNSIKNPIIFIETNIVGTQCLLQAALEHWQHNLAEHRFHHISTDEVYGSLEQNEQAFNEKNAYQPNSPYSASKASSDLLVRSYHKTYGMNIVITHCSNNYGPGQHDEKLIPTVIRACLSGTAIPIYGTGENIRDWLYVKDHCKLIQAIFEKSKAGETYCIGGRNEVSNIDLVRLICQELDSIFSQEPELHMQFPKCPKALGYSCNTLITFVEDRLGHDKRYAIDDSKLIDMLGEFTLMDLQTGIRNTVKSNIIKNYRK